MVDPISDLRAGTVARQGKARFSRPSGDASVIGVSPGLPISQKETAMMNNHVDEHLIEAAKEQAHEAAEEAAKEAAQEAYRETYDEVYKGVYPEAYKEALQRLR
jgi:hypothetical protein